MRKPVVFMFPGQGAQYYQMAKELYNEHPRFKLWMDHCDELARPHIQTSLMNVIYSGKKNENFGRIIYSSPALLAVEYSLAKIIMEMGIHPDYLMGYSLGEFTAAVISGAMSVEQGITLVIEYAKILEAKSPPAAMLAIIASEEILTEYSDLFHNCWLTGRNFHNNFVVSGLLNDILRVQQALMGQSIPCQKLPVNYAFHTPIMDPLEHDFKHATQQIYFSDLKIPTVSALKAKQIDEVDTDYFWELVRQPIEFAKTIHLMLEKQDYLFIDVGPSGTLATAVKYLLPDGSCSQQIEVINQFGRDLRSLEKLTKLTLQSCNESVACIPC